MNYERKELVQILKSGLNSIDALEERSTRDNETEFYDACIDECLSLYGQLIQEYLKGRQKVKVEIQEEKLGGMVYEG